LNNGDNWEKELAELKRSIPRSPFVNFMETLSKRQRTLEVNSNKFEESEKSAK